jgi:protein-disulfide isomerase
MLISRGSVLLVAAALAAAAAGCPQGGSRSSGSGGATARARDPKAPVAKLGGETITESELATAAKSQLTRAEGEYAENVYRIKSQALDELIEKRLIAAKAKAEGLTPEKLIEREVTAKIAAPSDSEIQMIYDRTKASGRPLPPIEQVKDQIVAFIKDRNQDQARRSFTDKLKADAKIEILLPPVMPPKVEVAADGHSKGGDKNAPVTIVEFSDYECPFCSRAEPVVKKILDEYKNKVRFVYRDYPLPNHSKAPKASEAALCAGDQNKYWEMHEKLFANQTALDVPQLRQYASTIEGLDAAKWQKCFDSGEKAKVVEASKKAGDQAGVSGTPAFFINGRLISGAQGFDKFKALIDHELAGGS